MSTLDDFRPALGPISLGLSASSGSAIVEAPAPAPIRWRFLSGPATGGYASELTAAQDRKVTVRLADPSELGFTIDGRHPEAEGLDELSTDMHALWTGPDGETWNIFRGRIGTTADTIDDDSHRITFSALDYRSLLGRRILYSTDTLTYTGVDIGETAWRLIAATQAHVAGNLGISKAWTGTAPTTVNKDWTFVAGDNIAEKIKTVSETTDGFDYDIVPVSPSALSFQVWHPQRGTNRGVVLEYGGLVTSARREVQPATYANAIRYSGADTLTAREYEAADLAGRAEGRFDAVFADTGIEAQATLDDAAAHKLTESQVIRPTWSVTLRRDGWEGPAHIWLGDSVRLVVRSGCRDVDTVLRVFEIAFTISADGGETVELTLDGRKPDYRWAPKETDLRLTNLERR